MSQTPNAAQQYSTFVNLLTELEQFADTHDVKLAFDSEGNVYLIGNGFSEQLQSNLQIWREVQKEMRNIIAENCPRVHPQGQDQAIE